MDRGGAKLESSISDSTDSDNMEMTNNGLEPFNISMMGLEDQSNKLYQSLLWERLQDIGVITEEDEFKPNWKLKFDKMLNKLTNTDGRYKTVDTIGDGNCLFRAISNAVYGNEALHSKLREKTVEKITSGEKSLDLTHRYEACNRRICKQSEEVTIHKGYVMKSLRTGTQVVYTKEEYTNIMSLDATYGTHTELDILSFL